MPMRATKAGKALVWVLALLAPAQPVLALDCSCCCKVVSSAGDQHACKRASCPCQEHVSCGHREAEQTPDATATHDDHDQPGNTDAERRFSGYHPCNCPQDCGCHLRHATRLGILSAPAARVTKDLCSVPLAYVSLRFTLPMHEQQTDAPPRNFCREISALAVCALLCRFAS